MSMLPAYQTPQTQSTIKSIAYEIFAMGVYECPMVIDAASVRRIVDLGANVGYSCLYWRRVFPQASLTAFEPHPTHCQQIRRHLEINEMPDRVNLVAAAAASASGEMFLTDEGPESQLHAAARPGSLRVPVVDWFEAVGSEPVDLLKLDIEGGEYVLLADERFAELSCRMCVVEWHQTSEYPDGAAWCTERFGKLGYKTVKPGKLVTERAGLLWAFKDQV